MSINLSNFYIFSPDEEQFDENEVGLLGRKTIASGFNDPEDDEADRIYAEIDEKMAERRRSRREAREEEELKRQEAFRPKTQLIFADLKRDLSRVSEAEWAALPEVGDFRIKRLKRSGAIENPKERFLPVPDSVHANLINNQTGIVQDIEGDEEDLTKIGEARGKLLGMHLDQLSQGQCQSNQPGPELTADSLAVASDEKLAEIGDLKRARQLFASIIKTNKKNPSGWISAARLEFQAGNQKQARALISKGCEECPKSEEIWSESIKMHEGTPQAREFLAKALKNLPEAVNLWLLASERETDTSAKRKILRSALERNSSSSKLWMALVELEDSEEDARLLLTRAVECSSDSVELWLALARLQGSTTEARKVLNRARLACPKSFAVWINAARLEEANDTPAAEIKKLLSRGAMELSSQGVELTLQDWQSEAEDCEVGGDLICAAELIAIGVELSFAIDSVGTANKILNYARDQNNNHVTCIKSALTTILAKQPDCKDAVILLIKNMKSTDDGNFFELKQIYETALKNIANDSDLWISYARDFKTESHDILTRASGSLLNESDQIKIWKEAITLEMTNFRKNPNQVEIFLTKLPMNSELMIEMMRVYQVLGLMSRAQEIAMNCTKKFAKEAEFWICLSTSRPIDEAISILKRGLENNAQSVKLALKFAEICDDATAVQVILEKTRLAIQKSGSKFEGYDQILAALCLLNCPNTTNTTVFPSSFNPNPIICAKNANATNLQAAKLILNQSLKELPKSALLWHLAVALEPRQLRRSKVTEALRRFENNGNGNNESKKDEAVLRWTLAMLLDGPAREAELTKALTLDPLNMDLLAYTHTDVNSTEENWTETSGVNWKRFIEREGLFFEPISESFDKFINFINQNETMTM